MRGLIFSKRVFKEIVRDPLNICFGLGFPLVILILLTVIQSNIPISLFQIDSLAPGVTVFGLAFMTLFSATVVSKDRTSSFIQRLYTTPMSALDFITGYTLPVIPLCMLQAIVCYIAAAVLGMKITVNVLLSVFSIIPASLLYISFGLLCGSIFNDKQVGGICGALLTNLSAWFSGIWFDVEMVGGVFEKIAYVLPFIHAVELERCIVAGNYISALPHLAWVIAYACILSALAVWAFLRKMKTK